jgi:hypothetical protein
LAIFLDSDNTTAVDLGGKSKLLTFYPLRLIEVFLRELNRESGDQPGNYCVNSLRIAADTEIFADKLLEKICSISVIAGNVVQNLLTDTDVLIGTGVMYLEVLKKLEDRIEVVDSTCTDCLVEFLGTDAEGDIRIEVELKISQDSYILRILLQDLLLILSRVVGTDLLNEVSEMK